MRLGSGATGAYPVEGGESGAANLVSNGRSAISPAVEPLARDSRGRKLSLPYDALRGRAFADKLAMLRLRETAHEPAASHPAFCNPGLVLPLALCGFPLNDVVVTAADNDKIFGVPGSPGASGENMVKAQIVCRAAYRAVSADESTTAVARKDMLIHGGYGFYAREITTRQQHERDSALPAPSPSVVSVVAQQEQT